MLQVQEAYSPTFWNQKSKIWKYGAEGRELVFAIIYTKVFTINKWTPTTLFYQKKKQIKQPSFLFFFIIIIIFYGGNGKPVIKPF
jgi:hypothetical protein